MVIKLILWDRGRENGGSVLKTTFIHPWHAFINRERAAGHGGEEDDGSRRIWLQPHPVEIMTPEQPHSAQWTRFPSASTRIRNHHATHTHAHTHTSRFDLIWVPPYLIRGRGQSGAGGRLREAGPWTAKAARAVSRVSFQTQSRKLCSFGRNSQTLDF